MASYKGSVRKGRSLAQIPSKTGGSGLKGIKRSLNPNNLIIKYTTTYNKAVKDLGQKIVNEIESKLKTTTLTYPEIYPLFSDKIFAHFSQTTFPLLCTAIVQFKKIKRPSKKGKK